MTESAHSSWSSIMIDAGISHTIANDTIDYQAKTPVATFRFKLTFPDNQAVTTATFEPRCSATFKKALLGYLNVCNNKLIGVFCVDLESGEIRYRRSTDLTGIQVTPSFVTHFIQSSWEACACMYRPLLQVLVGASTEKAQSLLEAECKRKK